GQNFLIPGHGGVKYHLAHPICGGSDGSTLEHSTIGQNQSCLQHISHLYLYSVHFIAKPSKIQEILAGFFMSFLKSELWTNARDIPLDSRAKCSINHILPEVFPCLWYSFARWCSTFSWWRAFVCWASGSWGSWNPAS